MQAFRQLLDADRLAVTMDPAYHFQIIFHGRGDLRMLQKGVTLQGIEIIGLGHGSILSFNLQYYLYLFSYARFYEWGG